MWAAAPRGSPQQQQRLPAHPAGSWPWRQGRRPAPHSCCAAARSQKPRHRPECGCRCGGNPSAPEGRGRGRFKVGRRGGCSCWGEVWHHSLNRNHSAMPFMKQPPQTSPHTHASLFPSFPPPPHTYSHLQPGPQPVLQQDALHQSVMLPGGSLKPARRRGEGGNTVSRSSTLCWGSQQPPPTVT